MIEDIAADAVNAARQGEGLRLSGNYSQAITFFDRAIELKPVYSWAYAHRGAARGALGAFAGAHADFARAKECRSSPYPWLLAQQGEVFREQARALMSTDPPQGMSFAAQAIAAFTAAYETMTNDPWVVAHRGATHTLRYWVSLHKGSEDAQRDFSQANADFTEACRLNPSYGWAFAFRAFLVGLRGDLDLSEKLIREAETAGLDRPLTILRVMMQLAIYRNDPRGFNAAVGFAWQTLQLDSEDSFARYYVANGLNALGSPEAPDAIRRARLALNDTQALLLAMTGGLDCMEGKTELAMGKLADLLAHRNIEALAMIQRDPAWAPLRSGNPDEAHDHYRKLFEY
jgi:tetratricopeptide (TPR) repeat protein